MDLGLIMTAFIAGLLTFLAPCTLPLVPGFLGFISGVSVDELQNSKPSSSTRRRIFLNGVLYVIGFSLVFILLGSLFGLGGAALVKYRLVLAKWGGIIVILFGFYMIVSQFKSSFILSRWRLFQSLEKERRLSVRWLKPGKPVSSLLFGAIFAFGWSPCIGPILGTVLLLASQSATVGTGIFLLTVFSLGLAVPFLIIAAGVGSALHYIRKVGPYLRIISIIGGVFLIFLGILLFTDGFNKWIGFSYQLLNFINYERILDYL